MLTRMIDDGYDTCRTKYRTRQVKVPAVSDNLITPQNIGIAINAILL